MIGWLQGELAEPWQQGNRFGILLICHGVGYEVHLSQRHWDSLPTPGASLVLHIHHACRDDGATLYGFPQRPERDLFRELVAVSGIGPQMALGLVGCLHLEDLVRAIVHGDLRRLVAAPGVGKRTAERLSVELRQRLQERFPALVDPGGGEEDQGFDEADGTPLQDGHREEVQFTLAALGYEPLEIQRALRAVAPSENLRDQPGAEDWIRESLRWLSRTAA